MRKLLAFFAILFMTILAAPVANAAPITLRNVNSNKCLEIQNSSRDNGARAQQWSCVGQQGAAWERQPFGDGRFFLVNTYSRKCLEIQNSSRDDGAQAQQWECGTQPGSYWRADGQRIVNVNSGKCLEIQNSSTNDGARAQQWSCADIPTMKWTW